MKIISGGQTGVDTAALIIALKLGYPYGGWVPKGRLNEDGKIPDDFPLLRETDTPDNNHRTILNVRESDALIVITGESESAGTELAIEEASRINIPSITVILSNGNDAQAVSRIRQFLRKHKPNAVNIAGPRESEANGICQKSQTLLEMALSKEQ